MGDYRYVGKVRQNLEWVESGKSKRKIGDLYQRRKASDKSNVGMGD